MIIETSRSKYEIFLEMIQFEITGRCNMRCKHCRAWQEPKKDLTIDMIDKVLDFAVPEACPEIRFTISGGEPFLHPQIFEILTLIKKKVDNTNNKIIHHTVITTNGSLITEEKIKRLEEIKFRELYVQVSIDSANFRKHDIFRSVPGAFEKAIRAVKLLAQSKLIASMRATITPDTLSEIESLILLAKKCGAKRIGFGSVIPTGKGKLNRRLVFTPIQKKTFLEKITEYKLKYPEIRISAEDPLKFAVCLKTWDFGDFDYKKPTFLGGCSAGIITINVRSDGTITPCSMLLKPIVDIKNKTPQEILRTYVSSKIIHNLIERKVEGKCKKCELKRLCGGCRAIAEGITNNYLAEDPTCWK